MVYLRELDLLSEREERGCIGADTRTIHNNKYPLDIFPPKQVSNLKFSEVTIIYGGNGSGKSTLLNLIASAVNSNKHNNFDKGVFFNNYVSKIDYNLNKNNLNEINMITSDDVFEYMLNIRSLNSGISTRKEDLKNEWLNSKYGDFKSNNFEYEELKKIVDSRKFTMSEYTRRRLANNNIPENSNGESALMYWQKEIKENGIYILDEPENSLSAENQIKLKEYLEESARFYNCQIILATHSPFLLSIKDALIYDLDSIPVTTKDWKELHNVKLYFEFFEANK